MKYKALLSGSGAIRKCLSHDKTEVRNRPSKCPVCFALWLHRRLETSIYRDDLDDLMHFARGVDHNGSVEFNQQAESA